MYIFKLMKYQNFKKIAPFSIIKLNNLKYLIRAQNISQNMQSIAIKSMKSSVDYDTLRIIMNVSFDFKYLLIKITLLFCMFLIL